MAFMLRFMCLFLFLHNTLSIYDSSSEEEDIKDFEFKIPYSSKLILKQNPIEHINTLYGFKSLNNPDLWYKPESTFNCKECGKRFVFSVWLNHHLFRKHVIPRLSPNSKLYLEVEYELKSLLSYFEFDVNQEEIVHQACLHYMLEYFELKPASFTQLDDYCNEFKYIWDAANIHQLYKVFYNIFFGGIVLGIFAFYLADIIAYLDRKYQR